MMQVHHLELHYWQGAYKMSTRRIPVLSTSDAIELKNRNNKNDIC
jgi:hypothetical protein